MAPTLIYHDGSWLIGGVPVQAVAFLGGVACCVVALIVFFMYLNKKLCFKDVGGFPCIDKPKKKHPKGEKLDPEEEAPIRVKQVFQIPGSAYAYEEQETSSDSDDEDLKNFKHAQKKRDSVRSSTGQYETATETASLCTETETGSEWL